MNGNRSLNTLQDNLKTRDLSSDSEEFLESFPRKDQYNSCVLLFHTFSVLYATPLGHSHPRHIYQVVSLFTFRWLAKSFLFSLFSHILPFSFALQPAC